MKKDLLLKTKKKIALSLLLTSVGLVSVGFSSWVVIEKRAIKNIDNISLEVANTSDERLRFMLWQNTGIVDGKVRFDAIYNDLEGLIQGSGNINQNEDLNFSIKFTIDIGSRGSFKGISIAAHEDKLKMYTWVMRDWIIAPFKITYSPNELEYVNLISKDWISPGNHYVYYDSKAAPTETDKDHLYNAEVIVELSPNRPNYRTYTINYSFLWGSTFKGLNPSICTDENAAKNALNEFAGIHGDQQLLTLTLKHDPDYQVII